MIPVRLRRLAAPAFSLALLALGLGLLAPAPARAATCLPVAALPGNGSLAAGGNLPRMAPLPVAVTPAQQPFMAAPLARGTAELTYLGHSSFLIRTPQHVTVITDYNGINRAPFPPEVVTMNHAHSSHYTDFIEEGVKHILRGWATPEAGYPVHDLTVRDLRIRNVATNIRDYAGGTEFAGNSIFIFETADLCMAHFGHLHHALTRDRLGRMGQIDVAMVPVDGSMTLPHEEMARAVLALGPKMVVPMHAFGRGSLERFAGLLEAAGYAPRRVDGRSFTVTRAALKGRTVLLFPGHFY